MGFYPRQKVHQDAEAAKAFQQVAPKSACDFFPVYAADAGALREMADRAEKGEPVCYVVSEREWATKLVGLARFTLTPPPKTPAQVREDVLASVSKEEFLRRAGIPEEEIALLIANG